MHFNFWQKFLLGVGIYHVVFGLILALFVQTDFMDTYFNRYFDVIFWPDTNIPAAASKYRNFSSAVLGSVIASWGIFITFLAHYPFKAREKWAWTCIAVAISLWFIIDTACSLYYGVNINALFNLFTLSLFAAPLFYTRKYFNDSI